MLFVKFKVGMMENFDFKLELKLVTGMLAVLVNI